MRLLKGGLALFVASSLIGCRSTPVSYFTLTPAETATNTDSNTRPLFKIILRLRPVPVELDTTRILLRRNDTQMRLEEDGQWTAPFADELDSALSDALRRRFGLLVSSRTEETSLLRVDLGLRRFEAVEGSSVSIAVDWSLSGPGKPRGELLSCQSVLTARAAGGVDGVVAAAQATILQLADEIGGAVRAAAAGIAPTCR